MNLEPMEYNGVRVDDRHIQDAIETLVKKGYRNEEIQRIVGMPQDVIDKVRHRMHAKT